MIQDRCKKEGRGRGKVYQGLYREIDKYIYELGGDLLYCRTPREGVRDLWQYRYLFCVVLNKEGNSTYRERLQKLVSKGYLDVAK